MAVDQDLPSSLEELEQVLNRVSGATYLLRDVRDLRALLVGRRPPRIAVIGRRGAGKSTLGNALLGARVLEVDAVQDTTRAGRWLDLEHAGHKLRWLDTPGLRPGDAVDKDRRESLRRLLAAELPDLIVLACRATQVESGIADDLAEVNWQIDRIKRAGLTAPPVVVALTRVDEVAPEHVKAPPFEGEKLENIDKAVDALRAAVDKAKLKVVDIIPVCCYQRFFRDGSLAIDWRWGLDKLADKMLGTLPVATQMEAARAFECNRDLRRRVAVRVVRACSSLAFLVGTTSIPIADTALLVPLQTTMITGVVLASGRRFEAKTVAEWGAGLGVNFATSMAFREIARAAVKLIPGLGSALSGMVAASGTWAIGQSAVRYFVDGADAKGAREAYEKAKMQGPPRDLIAPELPKAPEPAPQVMPEPAAKQPLPVERDGDPTS